jgi:2-keto-3-deoxy-L-arabinonate dehydratase
MVSRGSFKGIYPMLYTFFDAEGGIDRSAMNRQIDWCIESGAHGIAILGIVGEFPKLDVRERRALVEIVAEGVNGRVPLAVTVAETSVPGQIEFLKAAEAAGAAWTILQPPPIKGIPEIELVRFFGSVAEHAAKPVALQNNPVNLDVWLSNAGLSAVNRNHPNVWLLKGEGPVTVVHQCILETGGVFDVFSGLGGREITMSHRAGCVGCVPAPDATDIQVRIHELLTAGGHENEAKAEALHQSILPWIQYALHSPAHMLCYGKREFARRIGIEGVHVRAPALSPTEFGTNVAEYYSRLLPAAAAVRSQ